MYYRSKCQGMFDEDFTRAIWHPLLLLESGVADPDPNPDPYVFGRPGSGSEVRIRLRILLSSKNSSLLNVNDENSRIRIHLSEAWIRESGSIPKCHGSATLL